MTERRRDMKVERSVAPRSARVDDAFWFEMDTLSNATIWERKSHPTKTIIISECDQPYQIL
jgi:hypothetical protein